MHPLLTSRAISGAHFRDCVCSAKNAKPRFRGASSSRPVSRILHGGTPGSPMCPLLLRVPSRARTLARQERGLGARRDCVCSAKNAKPRFRGASGSRPVSRILSRVTISLGRRLPAARAAYPAPRRAASSEPASPCTGRGLASRRVTTALVGSYPTVSPLPPASPESRRRRSPFCATFRRLSPPGVSPASCPSVSGLSSSREAARGHPACSPEL